MNEQDISEEFDGPIIEAVRGVGDVEFKRADMDYWAAWAGALHQKRLMEYDADLKKNGALNEAAKAELKNRAKATPIQFFAVMDMQYVPAGIKKILFDGYTRAGGNPADWPKIEKRIGPQRQQQLASLICSEPVPTSAELRQALRDLLRKAGKAAPASLDNMSDEDLIAAARQFQPPSEPATNEGGEGPLSGPPGSESEPGSITSTAA